MMGPQAVKGSACAARAAQSLKVFDLTLPAPYVDMRFRRMSCCTSAAIISSAPLRRCHRLAGRQVM